MLPSTAGCNLLFLNLFGEKNEKKASEHKIPTWNWCLPLHYSVYTIALDHLTYRHAYLLAANCPSLATVSGWRTGGLNGLVTSEVLHHAFLTLPEMTCLQWFWARGPKKSKNWNIIWHWVFWLQVSSSKVMVHVLCVWGWKGITLNFSVAAVSW